MNKIPPTVVFQTIKILKYHYFKNYPIILIKDLEKMLKYKFPVRLHGEYNTTYTILALWKHVNLLL